MFLLKILSPLQPSCGVPGAVATKCLVLKPQYLRFLSLHGENDRRFYEPILSKRRGTSI